MNLKTALLLALLVLGSDGLYAQKHRPLYTPLNIRQAYENGTRQTDGRPGPAYWQNHSDYDIRVELKPDSREILGSAKIHYFNNSPDSLKILVLRLYQDIFKKGTARDFPADPRDVHDGVIIQRLSLNGTDLNEEDGDFNRRLTNLTIKLKDPLPARQSLQLEVDWQFVISRHSNVRMGSYDSTSFFVAYWYPQVAVYDDIDGWDKYVYGGLLEFYNDHNNYQVEITVPDEYLVWATGDWENPQEVLEEPFLQRYQAALKADSALKIVAQSDLDTKKIVRGSGKKSWKFKARAVPDFAFAVSDHYLWDMGSVVVDDRTNRRVAVSAAYKQSSKDFFDVARIGMKTVEYLSHEMPAVPFPYPKITVFNGQGGMEFPMMVNDGSSEKRSGTVHVTSHEISHTYFPFMMGTNERKYAWMDEGWAVFLPALFQKRNTNGYDPVARYTGYYQAVAGTEMDVPMMVPTIVYGLNAFRPTYRNAAYNRSSAAYFQLMELLGEPLFKKCLQEYVARWAGKHPMPLDFFNTFNSVAGENLNWFWIPWFFEQGYPDLAIKDAFVTGDQVHVIIENRGTIPVPVDLQITYTDGQQDTVYKSARVWQGSQKGFSIELERKNSKIKSLDLGNNHIPDADRKNNHFEF